MSFTNYLEHKVLDLVFGNTSFTPSGTGYIALSTTTPGAGEDGSSFTEPSSASGYARKAIINNKSNWSSAAQVGTSGTVYNLSGQTIGTASGNWGTVIYWGIYDAQSGGNLLVSSPLVVAKTPTSGDVVTFPSGSLVIRLD